MAALSPAVAVDGFESSRSSYSSCASFSSVSVISVSRFLLQRAMNVKLVLWVVALVEAILCNSHEGCAVGILLLAPYPCFLQGKRLLLQCEVRHPVKIEIVDFFDFGACNAEESTGDTCTPSKPLVSVGSGLHPPTARTSWQRVRWIGEGLLCGCILKHLGGEGLLCGCILKHLVAV